MFGAGKPPKVIDIGALREVGSEELRTTPQGKTAVVKRLRDHHHMLAKLIAVGMTNTQIAAMMDMSHSRVAILRGDASMRELVSHYRELADIDGVDFTTAKLMTESHAAGQRIIHQAFREAEDGEREIPLGTVLRTVSDLGDRIGYPKRTVSYNIDQSFGAKLDRAIERSKVKEITVESVGRPPAIAALASAPAPSLTPSGAGEGEGVGAVPRVDAPSSPISREKRRA